MKIAVIVVVCLLLAGGLMAGLAIWFARAGPGGKPGVSMTGGGGGMSVRVAPVGSGTLVEVVNAPGEVQAKTRVSISARVAARVAELPHKEGETVTKGDPKADPPVPASVLVRLDSKDLEAQLRSAKARYNGQAAERKVAEARIAAAEASLEAAKVTLIDLERSLRRNLKLFESKDISQQEVEAAQAKVDGQRATYQSAEFQLKADKANLLVMEHTLEAAMAEVERATEDLSYTVISSPIDGVITKIETEVGELAVTGMLNSPGTTIMEVADLSKMILVARVDETSIAQVKVGQKAKARVQAYNEDVFDGVVETVAMARAGGHGAQAAAQVQGTYFEVKILLDTKGKRILSGLNADVDIQTQSHEGVVTVPSQSVLGRTTDDLPPAARTKPEVDPNKTIATVVYRVENGKAVVTPVKVGPSDINNTVILGGLKPGDQVIVGPYKVLETLAEGQAVKVETVGAAASQPATKPAETQASQPATTEPATTQAAPAASS